MVHSMTWTIATGPAEIDLRLPEITDPSILFIKPLKPRSFYDAWPCPFSRRRCILRGKRDRVACPQIEKYAREDSNL